MKRIVVQIRGTSGSGKSYCAFNLLNKLDGVKLMKDGKVQGYRLAPPNGGPDIYLVGKYETDCGGADTIKTQDELCNRVRRYAAKGSVVFEGLLAAHIYTRFSTLSRDLGGMIWAYLDTPLSLCIERIEARRAGRGVTKPLNTKNTVGKHRSIHTSSGKALQAGQLVVYLDHRRAAEQVYELLTEGTLDSQLPRAGYRYEEGRRIALER